MFFEKWLKKAVSESWKQFSEKTFFPKRNYVLFFALFFHFTVLLFTTIVGGAALWQLISLSDPINYDYKEGWKLIQVN